MSQVQGEIQAILRQAYQIEIDGHTFYSMAATQADKPAVQELFVKLADDEVRHKAFLSSIMAGYEARGVAAFAVDRGDPDLVSFSGQVFSDRFREQAQGASFELGVLSIGMQLETKAITYFTQAAKAAEHAEVRDFYRFLADWEREHFEALQGLHNSVREEFWTRGGFSPF